MIAAAFACGFLWFLIWTIFYFVRKKKTGQKRIGAKGSKCVLLVELAVLLGLTGYYGYRIYQSAQHYNGRLGTYLYSRKTTRSIVPDDTDLDFLANGLNGILDSLKEECGLDRD